MNVIYVAGYGRSGSTLLDRSLGDRSSVTSLGELALGPGVATDTEHRCSCGQGLGSCELWRSVTLPSAPTDEGLVTLIRSLASAKAVRKHASVWNPTFQALEESPHCESTVVDSSKSTYARVARPWLLSKAGHTVLPVLIWRHPVEVLESRAAARSAGGVRGVAWFAVIEGMMSWVGANVFGLMICRQLGGLVVSFDDVVHRRSEVIERIATEATSRHGINLGQPGSSNGHLIAGNRMRVDPRGVGAERASRPSLSASQRRFVRAVTSGVSTILRKNS